MTKKIPLYLKKILKKNPKVASGRKNYLDSNDRIEKNLKLAKKFKKKLDFS